MHYLTRSSRPGAKSKHRQLLELHARSAQHHYVAYGIIAMCLALLYAALAGAQPTAGAAPPEAPRDPHGAVDGCAKGSQDESLFRRIADSYRAHLAWSGGAADAPPTLIVGGAEIPEAIPPWPYSTWNVGG